MTAPETAPADPRADRSRHHPRPGIALPGSGLPAPLLIALILLLAVALFLYLDARREARLHGAGPQESAALQAPPPPLALPSPPTPAFAIPQAVPATPLENPQPPMRTMPQAVPLPTMHEMPPSQYPALPPPWPQPPARALPGGSPGPALVVDLTSGAGAGVNGGEAGATAPDDAVRATLIHNRASVIPQGAIMSAVLETPLDSDRPGLARALVSHDVRGFDGSRVLIPRGSRLIGEFKADASPGLRRILITWTRLIRPDGVAIRIGSPASDSMGGSGVPGSVNTHFLARFSGAVLQSALAVGVNLASQIPASGNVIYLGLPSQTTQLGQQLVPAANRAPTVRVKEGAEIAVMVAHDLDFSGTPAVR